VTIQKQKLISILFTAAVILLVLNVAVDRINKPKKVNPVSELTSSKIEIDFFTILEEYGIEPKWVKRKKSKSDLYDSVKIEYEVKVPFDVPVPLIIKEINSKFEKDITGFVANEKKFFGKTEMRIYTNEVLKLKATLIPDKSIVQRKNNLSFIINDAFNLGDKDFSDFLKIPYPLSCIVIPGKEVIFKADSLKDYSKEYVIMLNDDIQESKMKLKPEFTQEILNQAAGNISSAFKDAKAYIVDENSVIYKSKIFNYVKNKFKDLQINLYPKSKFLQIAGKDSTELHRNFEKLSGDTNTTSNKIFFITFDDFNRIEKKIADLRKRGNKIISVSKQIKFVSFR
jgi:hypothetical protein